MITTEQYLSEHQPVIDLYINCQKDLSKTKSTINRMIEDANKLQYRLQFDNLDQLLDERQPVNCTHHMISCLRPQDPQFEILAHLQAAQSSTKKNTNITTPIHIIM